jgi:hypothetical protein
MILRPFLFDLHNLLAGMLSFWLPANAYRVKENQGIAVTSKANATVSSVSHWPS